MIKMGLDIGTGFVKCVSNYGSVRFPSLYVKRIHGAWTEKATEAVGTRAHSMLSTMGAAGIAPIKRGKPDPKYPKQVEMLIREAVEQVCSMSKAPADPKGKASMVVGLPYHAYDYKDSMCRTIKRVFDTEVCVAVPQASGTLLDMGKRSGIVVSIGQGTTEILVIDGMDVIDGLSSQWASNFVTTKVGRFAHLDPAELEQEKATCKKYSKVMAEYLTNEITDVAAGYKNKYPIAVSGGGLLLPGMKDELLGGLKAFKILVPEDPVMSNARGLYKLLLE